MHDRGCMFGLCQLALLSGERNRSAPKCPTQSSHVKKNCLDWNRLQIGELHTFVYCNLNRGTFTGRHTELLAEWIYVQETEKCVSTAYVYSHLYLARSAQIVLKMALKLQMVHIGQEEPSFSSEVIIILWPLVEERVSVLRCFSHMYFDCEAPR